jgi:phage replication-related protein YjqB (UPF0714/DUF867 family)
MAQDPPSLRGVLAELIASRGVLESVRLRRRVGVMALHGGLEAGTARAAIACARLASASLYTVVQPDDLHWHVPSTKFDPAQSSNLAAFLEHVELAVSFHGFGRRGLEDTVLVGGSNLRVRALIVDAIRARTGLRVIGDTDEIPRKLRGADPRNPVNLPVNGGVQIELSPQVRDGPPLRSVVAAVAGVLAAEPV